MVHVCFFINLQKKPFEARCCCVYIDVLGIFLTLAKKKGSITDMIQIYSRTFI